MGLDYQRQPQKYLFHHEHQVNHQIERAALQFLWEKIKQISTNRL